MLNAMLMIVISVVESDDLSALANIPHIMVLLITISSKNIPLAMSIWSECEEARDGK